ncbi:hypothetical protein TWF225_006943 [Orbilia oligospora]|uniref:Uncharacterized protein n=1 Tax=Orbilia oligospora TaxID=2813651 RepID=A0A7C8PW59_ORBOL|nr:hypothetical protein TWF751_008320 [Orbilia oligospora]KAF3194397.1 hypothetical protein TWF225_006943 [Orbilia oligospora]KAF3246180.1 hypothetical protein TWF128_008993 [Orbilia oligospora]KAF3264148.1 hypothetical protein TWF217_003303 [Orbilia oligospora]TGJ68572.1 hypothetical protein EYR41_007616 [Orbilia oligospora]
MSTMTTGNSEPPEPGLAGPSVTAARRPVKRRRPRKEPSPTPSITPRSPNKHPPVHCQRCRFSYDTKDRVEVLRHHLRTWNGLLKADAFKEAEESSDISNDIERERLRKEPERERMEEEEELEKRRKARLEREQVEYLLQRVKRLEKEVEERDRQLAHQSQVIRGLQRSAAVLSQNPGSTPGTSRGPRAGTFFGLGPDSAPRPERIPRLQPRSRSPRSPRSLSPYSPRHSSPHTPRRHSSLGPDSDTDHPAAATAG